MDTAPRTLTVLVNPKAGGEREQLAAATDALGRAGTTLRLVDMDPAGSHLGPLREQAPAIDGIVVAGGDGTVSRLLPELVALGKPVGVLPMGTANDLARTLGIPFDGAGAAEVILQGTTRPIDLGRANGIYFCNAAGIGASVQVSRELDRTEKSAWGVLAYGRAVWRVLERAPGFRVSVDCSDGVTYHGRATQVTIANGVHYGGGMTVHETAAIDDGELDLLVLRPESPLHYLRHFLAFRRGRYQRAAAVWAGRAHRVEVRTARARDCALDGEIRTRTPVAISIERHALEVFVPRHSGDG
ncbi:MAG TPA: YegS/Rv2252/BmrU family lipid kinase [Steroidobacteraceae bacterium]|nr:YegS/Rv2252/BmrU family lipid kinase [Steroidobacteraceae bacterium]